MSKPPSRPVPLSPTTRRGACRRASLAASLLPLLALGGPSALAQAGSAPATPSLPPGPLGGSFDASRFLVTSAANEHGAFLWIVDAVQRTVTLCEKVPEAKEVACTKRALP